LAAVFKVAEKVVIIDYGSGNLRSAAKALQRASDDAHMNIELIISTSADDVRSADRLVLPGVGAFSQCAGALRALPGVWHMLTEKVIDQATPFLGICVGMQLMATRGLEHGSHAGLGWIAGEVVKLQPADSALKVPHMGWNTVVTRAADHPLLQSLTANSSVYFVHGYRLAARNAADILAHTTHGEDIAAVVGRDNFIGTQFHPEKSQGVGLAFLSAFLKWKP
jgi:imidazole glycerol-phosphate synthase subunit HisH